MKKLVLAFAALLFAFAAALAQTPEEIVSRMEAEMNSHAGEGIAMTVDIKIPILGTATSRSYVYGSKLRVEMKMMGAQVVTWSDGETSWIYVSKDNSLTIQSAGHKKANTGDTELFMGITDGYDVSMKKETAGAWHLLCKKSKGNKDEDDPKTMDLVVSKKNYYPLSLKASMSGMTMTMRDISFDVTEADVTFDAARYPDAKVTDKR